ncbi:MAG TPA: hypothetical protein VEI73_00660 [Candidatus Acidoferrum sp.]|nr:hypothetical protein [Candidatus Acidoferrum sp.]
MTKCLKAAVLSAGLAMSLNCGQLCAAQQSKQTTPAPVPALIEEAKKVFIANGGGDESLYSGGPDRLYNEFYAAMKSWGRYELVGSPAEADLVIEIRLIVFQPSRSEAFGDQNREYDSQFHLAIRDVKTHETLWGLIEHAQTAILQGNRDKNFEQALTAILSELQKLAGPAQPAAKSPTS